MSDDLPSGAGHLAKRHPKVWAAYANLGAAVAEEGPLDAKTRRLVKLALSIGKESEGAVHSHVRRAVSEGITADLIITGTNRDGWALDPARRLDPSALVMQAGRPVFFVPPEAEWLELGTVLVAWKDTREARRAVWDALPLLQRAQEVTISEVPEGEENPEAARNRVNDVAGWLARHGVAADVLVPEAVDNASERLELIASDLGADLVVAGDYGHTRLGEWMFGGVTRDLVTRSTRCSVFAH